MAKLHWTISEARNFLVQYHMINTKERLTGKDAIKTIFNKIRTIQFDPLDVVGRNPDLVLQSRIKNYRKHYLHEMLYEDRYLVDGWDKMMSIYQTSDFHNFQRIRDYRTNMADGYHRFHAIEHAVDFSQEVLNMIKEKGPLFSREIDIENRWKHGKLSSVTLDYLFISGQIVVYNKVANQKQFELTEKIITPKECLMNEKEFIQWYLKRRIASMGLVWNKSSVSWSGAHIEKKTTRTKYINQLLENNVLTKVMIEDIKEPFYVLTDALDNLSVIQKRVSFIAPLDNMIWDRQLMKTIFNIDYSWEVYVPKKKRKYGYYVLPILYGSNFIGRIEFEHQRKNKPLVIKNIWFEPNIKRTKTLNKKLTQAINEFKKYLGALEVIRNES